MTLSLQTRFQIWSQPEVHLSHQLSWGLGLLIRRKSTEKKLIFQFVLHSCRLSHFLTNLFVSIDYVNTVYM